MVVDLEAVRSDASTLMFVSDGSRGADKIARILAAVPDMIGELEAHRAREATPA